MSNRARQRPARRTNTPTSRTGDCFKVAANLVMESDDRHVLCHGEPLGQASIAGIRHAHAWVERTTTVHFPNVGPITVVEALDYSNGKHLEMAVMMYYKIGRLDGTDIRRYTRREAAQLMADTGTYGPWH